MKTKIKNKNQLNIATMTLTVYDMTDNNINLSVLSLNINGMSEDKKRCKLFEILTNKYINIILLQEMHSKDKLISKWGKEWLGKSFWNSGKLTQFSGVAMLLKKDLNIKISTTLKDKEGRILSLNFLYQIINIYAPTRNSEKYKFYQHLKNYIDPK